MKKFIFLFFVVFLWGCIEEPLTEFSVEAICDSNGYVTPNSVTATDRDTVVFIVTVEDDCIISNVIANGKNITSSLKGNILSLSNIKSDLKVSFIITKKEVPLKDFVITANSGQNGSISPSGEITLKENASFAFNMAPVNIGFEMDELKVNDVVIPNAPSYTFENISSDNNIAVSWKKDSIIWPLINIKWRLYSVDIDSSSVRYYNTFVETLDFSPDGVVTWVWHGEITIIFKLVVDKKNLTIMLSGGLCDLSINEKILKMSYKNSFNQKVVYTYVNEGYKNSPQSNKGN